MQYSIRKVDIIIPVYEGESTVRICMESVLKSSQKADHEIIVVNDCSPNRAIVDYLLELESQKKITLLNSEKNIGFVQSVNRGMSYHAETDVVLLNSDTEVANNWLDRLQLTAYRDKKIGTCTPFSNNAEICSFPGLCSDNEIPLNHNTASLDKLFSLGR
jgi:GT2 family glycosyltransferase